MKIFERKRAESHLRAYLTPKRSQRKLEEIARETVQQIVSTIHQKVWQHTLLNTLGTLSDILKSAKAYGYTRGNFLQNEHVLLTKKSLIGRCSGSRLSPPDIRDPIFGE